MNPFEVVGGVVYIDEARIRNLGAAQINNAAGLIRSQRIAETIAYANGATATDYDYEVSRLTSVSLSQSTTKAEIVFNVTKLRVKNSDPGLTTGGVKTTHISLNATADVYGVTVNKQVSTSQSWSEAARVRDVPGGTGFEYLVKASVFGTEKIAARILRGSSPVASDLNAVDTTGASVAKYLSASGPHSSEADFVLQVKVATGQSGGTVGAYRSDLSVTLVKR